MLGPALCGDGWCALCKPPPGLQGHRPGCWVPVGAPAWESDQVLKTSQAQRRRPPGVGGPLGSTLTKPSPLQLADMAPSTTIVLGVHRHPTK